MSKLLITIGGWNLVRLTQAAFILSVVLVAASISYYLIVVKPRVEAAKLEQRQNELGQRQQEKANAEMALDSCLGNSLKLARSSLDRLRASTQAPLEQSLDDVERNFRLDNDECHRRYPQPQ